MCVLTIVITHLTILIKLQVNSLDGDLVHTASTTALAARRTDNELSAAIVSRLSSPVRLVTHTTCSLAIIWHQTHTHTYLIQCTESQETLVFDLCMAEWPGTLAYWTKNQTTVTCVIVDYSYQIWIFNVSIVTEQIECSLQYFHRIAQQHFCSILNISPISYLRNFFKLQLLNYNNQKLSFKNRKLVSGSSS